MSRSDNSATTILVVDDVEEILDGTEKLLQADGYHVEPARSEVRAVESAQRKSPHLILMNLEGAPEDVISAAHRIRERAKLDTRVPVVLLCDHGVAEGAEVGVGDNVYVTRPDNFNQLRAFICRLLQLPSAPTEPRAGAKSSVDLTRF